MAIDYQTLRAGEIWQGLTSEELSAIAERSELITYGLQGIIIESNQLLHAVDTVVSGLVGIFVKDEAKGEIKPLSLLGPGRALGVTAMLSRRVPSSAFSMALMPTTVVRVEAAVLQRIFREQHALALQVYENLLNTLNDRLSEVFRTVETDQVVFSMEESCPSLRPTRILAQVAPSQGRLFATCQRRFACEVVEGNGCPLAGRPTLVPHEVGTRST